MRGAEGMSEIARTTDKRLTDFDPSKTHEKISVLKAAIQHANEMRDWEALSDAVSWMVQEQKHFVEWWNANVGVRLSSGNNQHKRLNADLRSTYSREKAEADTGISQQQVSRWRTGLKRPDYRQRIEIPSYKKAFGIEGRRADLQTGEMEWFTPAEYVERARRVLGKIDLDPASCAAAQQTINAAKFYTEAEDGLRRDWFGAVWLNPPYAGKLVAAFASKMVESWVGGNLTAAIMLTNSYTETSWFHSLASACNAVCFTRGRIKFESPHGEKCAPTNGQCFFYFGDNVPLFFKEFSSVGLTMVKADG